MSFRARRHGWNQGFYGSAPGAGQVAVGSIYDVALGGRGYMLDLEMQGNLAYGFATIPKLRVGQVNQPQNVGEQTLNVEDYWRRSADSWHLGAGQKFFDHPNSDEHRFRTSKGIYVWEPGEITLLNTTASVLADATMVAAVVAGAYLYVLNAATLKYTTDLSAFTTVTAAGGDAAISSGVSITTDGYTVWVADGTRVHYTTRAGATFAKYHTSDHVAEIIRSVKGRLLSGKDNILYTHSGAAGSATATALFTHPNADWTWTDFAGGQNAIYAAGYSGDKSIIYRTAVEADGTDLSIPTAAAELPDGEIVRSLHAYLSILLIGTDNGVRIAQMGGDGTLTLGTLIDTSSSVKCFEPQGKYVWFGWTAYDATSTGLGRMDLENFVNDAPAYASDLMATTSGAINSVVTFSDLRCFVVSGVGLYKEDTTSKVASGTLYSGWANFDLPDPKIAVKFLTSYRAGGGTFTVALANDDDGTYTQLGDVVTTSASEGGDVTLPVGQAAGKEFEWKITLTRSATTATQAPVVNRSTLMVNPTPPRRLAFTIPIRLHEEQLGRNRAALRFDPSAERAVLWALCNAGTVVAYTETGASYTVTVEDLQWVPLEEPGIPKSWDGTLVVRAMGAS